MAKWGTKEPPKKEGRYVVTVEIFGRRAIDIADRKFDNGRWKWYRSRASEYGHMPDREVLAWQKINPYMGDKNNGAK